MAVEIDGEEGGEGEAGEEEMEEEEGQGNQRCTSRPRKGGDKQAESAVEVVRLGQADVCRQVEIDPTNPHFLVVPGVCLPQSRKCVS